MVLTQTSPKLIVGLTMAVSGEVAMGGGGSNTPR